MTTNSDDTNVANNVAQGNSQDLTEQWKKGELEQGWYYIECFDEPERWIDLDFYRTDIYEKGVGYFSHNDWRGIAKVIAPAPSYEEWHYMKEDNRVFEDKIHNLYQEIGHLKELLYNSMFYLNCHVNDDGDVFVNDVSTSSFIEEIDNAIGEKK